MLTGDVLDKVVRREGEGESEDVGGDGEDLGKSDGEGIRLAGEGVKGGLTLQVADGWVVGRVLNCCSLLSDVQAILHKNEAWMYIH